MNFLSKLLLKMDEYNQIVKTVGDNKSASVSGLSDSQKAHVTYSLCEHLNKKGIYISFDEVEARKIYEDFLLFFEDDVLYFPLKEITLYDVEAKSQDNIYKRLEILERVIRGDYRFVVLSLDALLQKLVSPELYKKSIVEIEVGISLDITLFTQKLIEIGFERVREVEVKGQFAIRGGIIDIFPVNSHQPIRIELFDDEVDSIRVFDTTTKRSIDKVNGINIIPAREIIYTADKRQSIINEISKELNDVMRKSDAKHADLLSSKINDDIDKINNNYYYQGIDRYIPYLVDNASTIIDYASDTLIFVDEYSKMKVRSEIINFEFFESCKNLMEKGQLLPGSIYSRFDFIDIQRKFECENAIYLKTFISEEKEILCRQFEIQSKSISSYLNHVDFLINDLKQWKENKYKVLVLSGTKARGQRLKESLRDEGVEALYRDDFTSEIENGQVVITHGSLNKGFEYPDIGVAIVSDKEVFGKDRKHRKAPSKSAGSKINIFTELNIGDYVVHENHGIGQYTGIEQLIVDNIRRDYLKIRYNDEGFLYIPTNQLDMIQKYIGSEGKAPKLHKLNGSEWTKTKKRVKESLKEIAEELVKLYAKRQILKGYSFSKDTVWQKQFEETFVYEETDDQLKCIEEVKRDMEMEKPMDRLLCGDVGYGKTEVAIRAIFKAVMDGKQVAYLVPTTILAQQHYNNFASRMKEFPITVDVISRFRTAADQKGILKDVKKGNIDVLVGTHRLLQKDLEFKDLGLLIIDEEQRFGVTHKEKIKNLKPNLDVLTLTATPIPRTLHMSLVGIRDISVIEDPPEERLPVETYVMEYNADIVKDAVRREISRGGQVFYLYNKVGTIMKKASEIQALVPEARIAIGHGQMNEKELEDIIYDFINCKYDLLVCTTIIESGLDMPNVNTMIIEDADKMGLAQLYQLRGRVGRSNKAAYAYITYRKDKVLAETAEKRLQAIREFTDLGSGFKIAMRDLEIRGAGNLLGSRQHGQMESVGYDMYCKLLDESVRELKGEESAMVTDEITIDLNVNAYIDNSYIEMENHKINMYKKIASIQNEQDVSEIEDELIDRYGDIPMPVRNLLHIAYMKTLAAACGFVSISEKSGSVILQYKNEAKVDFSIINGLMELYRRKILFNASSKPYITYLSKEVKREEFAENIKILLQNIKKLQDCK